MAPVPRRSARARRRTAGARPAAVRPEPNMVSDPVGLLHPRAGRIAGVHAAAVVVRGGRAAGLVVVVGCGLLVELGARHRSAGAAGLAAEQRGLAHVVRRDALAEGPAPGETA